MKILFRNSIFFLRYIFVFFLVLLQIGVAYCTIDSLDRIQISLITCDPGDGIDMLFGHSAIRVKDGVNDIVYNYGTFDFDTPGFVLKFMRGKLPYKLARNDFANFLRVYHFERRTVKEQVLNLSLNDKVHYFQFLENNALPENAFYKYDFFFDNCSTRIRDGLETVIGKLDYPSYKTSITYRNILHKYLQGSPWTRHGIDIIIGSLADQIADVRHQMFIPDYLHDHFGNTKNDDQMLLFKSKSLFEFPTEESNRKISGYVTPNLIYFFLIGFWLWLLFNNQRSVLKKATKVIYTLIGLAGLLIGFLWFGTDHIATKYNWNILWLNPICLLLLLKLESKNRLIKIGLLSLAIGMLILMLFNIVPQYHPSWSLALFVALVYGSDILYLDKKLTNA